MNSYWVVQTGLENDCETTKSLKICYLFNIKLERVCMPYHDLGRQRTEMTHQQRVGRSESHGYWICCWLLSSASTCSCCNI